MLKTYERPFDLVDSLKGKKVIVRCKAYKEYDLVGILHAFDAHLNLALEVFEEGKRNHRFVKGENVLFIEEYI